MLPSAVFCGTPYFVLGSIYKHAVAETFWFPRRSSGLVGPSLVAWVGEYLVSVCPRIRQGTRCVSPWTTCSSNDWTSWAAGACSSVDVGVLDRGSWGWMGRLSEPSSRVPRCRTGTRRRRLALRTAAHLAPASNTPCTAGTLEGSMNGNSIPATWSHTGSWPRGSSWRASHRIKSEIEGMVFWWSSVRMVLSRPHRRTIAPQTPVLCIQNSRRPT